MSHPMTAGDEVLPGQEATPGDGVDAIFNALADPTRRHVVRLLSQRSSVTASALAHELPISRQAISKHLSALSRAGLVSASQEGRETRYRLTPEPLGRAMEWMATTEARWDERLGRLAEHVAEGS